MMWPLFEFEKPEQREVREIKERLDKLEKETAIVKKWLKDSVMPSLVEIVRITTGFENVVKEIEKEDLGRVDKQKNS